MATISFKGKEIVRNYHLAVPYHELVPAVKKSLSKEPGLQDNLILHGDNLLALKALVPTYAGKVKCVYIDPPYNTGNEKWAYNDNVASPMVREWLGKVVDKDDLTRHDKWLCMMMPRLKLLRELMRDDGVIFVSIDDNEVHHLRLLMDEIFGQDNFIGQIVWQKIHSIKNDAKYYSENHEYITCYAQNKEIAKINLLSRTKEMDARYSNPDKDARGPWQSGDLVANEVRTEGDYEVVGPTGKKFKVPSGKHWVYSRPNLLSLIEDNRIWFGKDGSAFPRKKRFLSEVQQGRKVSTLWLSEDVGHNQEAIRELKQIFGRDIQFNNPKPSSLIRQVVEIATDKDDIILDSFAGSGTTAHSVLALNKEDGGQRKFVLVETEDYADTTTAERVRRVIKGVKKAHDENLRKGLGGSFSFYELGKPIDTERILTGRDLPSFAEMARYIFYTATGERFNERKVNEPKGFIGESQHYKVYLFYQPDMKYLKSTALTLERAEGLGKFVGKKRLVFAPAKFLDQEHLERLHIEFAQLPFEIYRKQ